ncbi:C40 family peptidase [Paenisporosarcina sp. FSL H8-0542]|uniref:C40 family peptidase n=1 Tax=Paenisporosarcina sp. FSL H8-0542 TaxID=2921401 RepID=UPI00315A6217
MKKRITQMIIAVLLISVAPFMTTQASASTENEIVNYAKTLQGVPYQYGGITPSGFDCSGYTSYVFKNIAGISLNRTAANQYSQGTSVSKSNLQPGDLVFFDNLGYTSHVGIYIGNSQFISATSSKGIAIASINDPYYWGKYYMGAKRIGSASVASTPPVTNGNFTDVKSTHPAYVAIKELNMDGVINGFENQQFRPNAEVTRGQAAAMVNRVLKLTPKNQSRFSDVPTNHTFAKDIAAMNEAGILSGYTSGRFGMNDSLTKSQLAVILDRAFKISAATENQVHTASIYNDVPKTYWAHDPIVALKTIDQTTVFQTSYYKVNAEASRAEFSAAVYSAIMAK